MIVNELYKEKQNNVLFVYYNLRQFLTKIWTLPFIEDP